MSLFDTLVDEAVRNRPALSALRPVVEKELLHHDILREMSEAEFLSKLTFMGGTCLRACYGSERLSEDLDFTGGSDFDPGSLTELARTLVGRLQEKYGLPADYRLPDINICSVPSHDRRPMMLRNQYGVDMGTSGLIVQAQSREEILADKYMAFAFRRNRLKNRDLWDIGWLTQQGIGLNYAFLPKKLIDHKRTANEFLHQLSDRQMLLNDDASIWDSFKNEMKRFLPLGQIAQTASSKEFWVYLTTLILEERKKVEGYFRSII